MERFWAKVDKRGPEECWLWTGAIVRKYGMFAVRLNGKRYMKKAHRIAYEIFMGPIPEGLVLDHICHVESCVNPFHLRPATVKQNAENRTGANSNSGSGVRGVHATGRSGKWKVAVIHNGKRHNGGTFTNLKEASEAASSLRAKLFTHSDEAA